VGASSQLGSLSTGTILGPRTGKTVWPGWIVLEGDLRDKLSRLKKMDLIYFIFIFIFYFIFNLFFYFLFLEQLGLGVIGHAITSVT